MKRFYLVLYIALLETVSIFAKDKPIDTERAELARVATPSLGQRNDSFQMTSDVVDLRCLQAAHQPDQKLQSNYPRQIRAKKKSFRRC